ncbi:hypothetical protein Esti_004679 [Eimeria stiedai]
MSGKSSITHFVAALLFIHHTGGEPLVVEEPPGGPIRQPARQPGGPHITNAPSSSQARARLAFMYETLTLLVSVSSDAEQPSSPATGFLPPSPTGLRNNSSSLEVSVHLRMSGACSGADEALGASLHAQGLPVRLCWVSEWLQQRGPSEAASGEAAEASLAAAFLSSDLRETGDPQLPPDVACWHRRRLAGVYVLQLLHAVNINEPHKHRSNTGLSKHRCLKLALTDGHVVVAAIEYKRISKLKEETLGAGAKFLVYGHPEVCRGLLFLQEDNLKVVWGGHPLPARSNPENAAPPQHLEQQMQQQQQQPLRQRPSAIGVPILALHPPRGSQAPTAPLPHPALSTAPQGPPTGNTDLEREAAGAPWGPLQQDPFAATRGGGQAPTQGGHGAGYQSDWTGAPNERQGPPSERPRPQAQAAQGNVMQRAHEPQRGPPYSAAPWEVKSGTTRGPPSGAPQGPPSYQQNYEAEASDLLIDLEDIADAFGQDNSPLHSAPSQWGAPSVKPAGPLLWQRPLPVIPAELSLAAGSCPAAFAEAGEAAAPRAEADALSASVGHEKRTWCMQSSQCQQTLSTGRPPFWLFGAVLDAREGRSGGADWELLVTDGMRVFHAFADGDMTEKMAEAVKQPALYRSLSAVERLRSVQGHFLLGLKGKHGKEEQVHVVSFRAIAPASELTEKLNFLYSAMTGKQE